MGQLLLFCNDFWELFFFTKLFVFHHFFIHTQQLTAILTSQKLRLLNQDQKLTIYLIIYFLFLVDHVVLSCFVSQSAGQTKMEEDTQHPPQGEEQLSDQTSVPAEAQPENSDEKETPMDIQEKSDSNGHPLAKPLWKPIPPLLPDTQRSAAVTETRDQSCQTEEEFQQTNGWSHGHKTGGKRFSFSALFTALSHPPMG